MESFTHSIQRTLFQNKKKEKRKKRRKKEFFSLLQLLEDSGTLLVPYHLKGHPLVQPCMDLSKLRRFFHGFLNSFSFRFLSFFSSFSSSFNPRQWNQVSEQEIFLFQREVELQLEEEEEKAEYLKHTLERANFLTSQVVSVLDSFDQRIKDLSMTIEPIHDLTQRLTTRTQSMALCEDFFSFSELFSMTFCQTLTPQCKI